MNQSMTLGDRVTAFQQIIQTSQISNDAGQPIALEEGLAQWFKQLEAIREAKKHLVLVGNGGSASVAAHATTDFFNVAKLNATTLHESSLLTCMANDFGYENAFARMIKQTMTQGDMLIAISSSGNSLNIRNAVKVAQEMGCQTVTLSGFAHSNPLRSMGKLNIWLDSNDYGFVEVGHQFVLHNIADRLRIALQG